MRRSGAAALVAALLITLLAGCGAEGAADAPVAVQMRSLALSRGADRPLPTTVWFPGRMAGRHPVILFSHGLGGLPAHFSALARGWAEAGYVVAAPAFPHTRSGVRIKRSDIRNQPADLIVVLRALRRLDGARGDVFQGRLDGSRVAAIGFSAGGTTTLGLLRDGHDPALRAAVSIAGRRPDITFGGDPAPVLFLHGDRDKVVPIEAGRRAFVAVPWPKRFVIIPGKAHGQYLKPGDPEFTRTSSTILRFLGEQMA